MGLFNVPKINSFSSYKTPNYYEVYNWMEQSSTTPEIKTLGLNTEFTPPESLYGVKAPKYQSETLSGDPMQNALNPENDPGHKIQSAATQIRFDQIMNQLKSVPQETEESNSTQPTETNTGNNGEEPSTITRKGTKWLNGISQGVAGAADVADKVFLGDKNFSTWSLIGDAGVDTFSGALIASGNPWAMGAGALLKVGNFATKALGQTVPGFNVNTGSGYGTMGSFQEHSGRIWDNVSGMMNRRNQEAQLALNAAEINNDIKFEQEARMNSVENTIRLNTIALAGGMDTSVLAAKRGAKLNRLVAFKDKPKTQIAKAENGMKLKKVEVSEELSLMPVGSMHKNLNHLDLEDITPKGIPVLQVKEGTDTDKIETKEQVEKVDYMQSAEIESEEIIFSKELTDFIEEKREEWNKSKDSELCKEVGMRLCKEILMNTKDENKVIKKIEEHVED